MPPETIVEIKGQLVRHIKQEIVSEAPLADYLDQLESHPPVTLPILPRNRTVGLHFDGSNPPMKRFNIALCQTPHVRVLPIAPGYAVPDLEPRVALPWTIFVFRMRTEADNPKGNDWLIESTGFYFSKDEPNGETDNFIPALLPNVYRNANICWGNTGVAVGQSLMNRIDQTVNEFYQTNFNHAGDIDYNFPFYKRTYKKWVADTQENGPGSYKGWPDWEDDRRQHLTFTQIMELKVDVKAPLVLPDGIPDLIVNPTFGRADEWLRGLNGTQRHRLRVAMDNLAAEDPNAFEVPALPALAAAPNAADDD